MAGTSSLAPTQLSQVTLAQSVVGTLTPCLIESLALNDKSTLIETALKVAAGTVAFSAVAVLGVLELAFRCALVVLASPGHFIASFLPEASEDGFSYSKTIFNPLVDHLQKSAEATWTSTKNIFRLAMDAAAPAGGSTGAEDSKTVKKANSANKTVEGKDKEQGLKDRTVSLVQTTTRALCTRRNLVIGATVLLVAGTAITAAVYADSIPTLSSLIPTFSSSAGASSTGEGVSTDPTETGSLIGSGVEWVRSAYSAVSKTAGNVWDRGGSWCGSWFNPTNTTGSSADTSAASAVPTQSALAEAPTVPTEVVSAEAATVPTEAVPTEAVVAASAASTATTEPVAASSAPRVTGIPSEKPEKPMSTSISQSLAKAAKAAKRKAEKPKASS